MNKIVYYIWNLSIIALIVISIIPFSTGLSNVVLGVSIICGIISYKKLEISKKSKLLIIAYCSLLGSLLIAGIYNGTVPGKTISFVISFVFVSSCCCTVFNCATLTASVSFVPAATDVICRVNPLSTSPTDTAAAVDFHVDVVSVDADFVVMS